MVRVTKLNGGSMVIKDGKAKKAFAKTLSQLAYLKGGISTLILIVPNTARARQLIREANRAAEKSEASAEMHMKKNRKE